MPKKKDLVTQEEIDKFLNHFSNNKLNQVQLLKLLQEMHIIIDGPTFEDSIDGTRIRVIYATEISRKGREEGEQEKNTVRFQYIKEIPIDYSKVPISFRNDVNTITESYSLLEENSPTLDKILGLLKRIYFMPEDFSNKLAIERIHRLRTMFTKEEVFAFPSVSLDYKAGLIPL